MPKTQIVCHRGASLSAPENTFPGAKKALELGGSIIELDIRQSSDGVLYVMHDETVDRTTDGQGKLADMSSADIDALDAGSWFDEAYKDTQVPRLRDYLSHFGQWAGFYLEVKEADCSAIGKLVAELGLEDRCFTFSFDPEMRQQMFLKAPNIRRMIHWSRSGSVDAVVNTHHASIVEFHEHDFDEADISACKNAGLQVMFFTDQPNEELFRKAMALDMDYVNIDYIELFDKLRREQ